MIKTIKFGNPGIIDPRVWSTFGVSVKDGDNPVGQFGTGLKYAIAVLMREGREMRIVSGSKEYVFGVETADIRGKEFQQITCNGEHMPFTTHLGAKWELWQAYRELASNCFDEGGVIGEDGETTIYAQIGDINHADVFLSINREALTTSRLCDIYAGRSEWVYVRGIRAKKLSTPSVYTYNLHKADLTEDRTVKYDFEVDQGISAAILETDNDHLARSFLLQTKDAFESRVNFGYTAEIPPSQHILAAVQQYRRENVYMQQSLAGRAIEVLGALAFDETQMDERQLRVVEKAAQFCEKIGYRIAYPIKMSESLGGSTLAVADSKTQTIYLSDRVLSQGTKQVASTLIEENIHLQKHLEDCTYNMQSYLFDQIVTMGEKLTGEIL